MQLNGNTRQWATIPQIHRDVIFLSQKKVIFLPLIFYSNLYSDSREQCLFLNAFQLFARCIYISQVGPQKRFTFTAGGKILFIFSSGSRPLVCIVLSLVAPLTAAPDAGRQARESLKSQTVTAFVSSSSSSVV